MEQLGRLALAALLALSLGAGPAGADEGVRSPAAGDDAGSAATLPPEGGEARTAAAARQLDVEELNDDLQLYTDRQVEIAGEIEDRLDAHSFVLESGGFFDDEVAVVIPESVRKQTDPSLLRNDADVVVTGTLRATPIVEVERELGWDLDPELELELESVAAYVVAEKIERQRR